MNKTLLFISILLSYFPLFSQINFSAHDSIPKYRGHFRFGVNPGSHYGWQDFQLANISVDLGINTFRPALPELFLEFWGYDIRLSTFQHYDTIGLKDNTVFVGYPNEEHREDEYHCPTARSETFANLYEPIWDNGENGTPVNDENYYAVYLYNMVSVYKDYVKFWEIWNEPDYSFTVNSVLSPENEESWWNSNPEPCEHSFRAPITHYVRMLRISYDVIKSIDSTAYVTTGGLGYPSYLDAILRNTDNPDNGLITSEYPLTGGAYFDVVSYHSYPHIDNSLRYWDDEIFDFSYTRHSDAAMEGYIRLKKEFEEVCISRGYDNETYPKKMWMVTESNIPRKKFQEHVGSDAAQRNYLVKAAIASMKEDIVQLHPYSLAELEVCHRQVDPFQAMGFYQKLGMPDQDALIGTDAGYAWKTASDALSGYIFDTILTERMEIPNNLNGAAFVNNSLEQVFVLWAKTKTDNSEVAQGFYTFPEYFAMDFLEIKNWNYSRTNKVAVVPNRDISLSGTPIFIRETTDFPEDYLLNIQLNAFPNPFQSQLNIELQIIDFEQVNLELINYQGTIVQHLIINQHLSEGVHQFTFSIENLVDGIYFLKLAVANQIRTVKLIKTSF